MQDTPSIRSVLAYLRDMVTYCAEQRRSDLAISYEDAVEFVAQRMYGKLPPVKHSSNYLAPQGIAANPDASPKTRAHQTAWQLATFVDDSPVTPPLGIRVNISECPVRKITGRFYKKINQQLVRYERLECGHEQTGPVGHEVMRSTRRCKRCRQEQLAAIAEKKKPASVTTPRGKVVSA
jgi:hypothetical protein